jgi:hypothetical protein
MLNTHDHERLSQRYTSNTNIHTQKKCEQENRGFKTSRKISDINLTWKRRKGRLWSNKGCRKLIPSSLWISMIVEEWSKRHKPKSKPHIYKQNHWTSKTNKGRPVIARTSARQQVQHYLVNYKESKHRLITQINLALEVVKSSTEVYIPTEMHKNKSQKSWKIKEHNLT